MACSLLRPAPALRRALCACAAASVLLLAGCSTDVVVTVRADGSGTLEQIVTRPKLGSDAKMPEIDAEKGKQIAKTLGEGVEYVSGETRDGAEEQTWHATFSFKDINKLNYEALYSASYNLVPQIAKLNLTTTGSDAGTLVLQFPPGTPEFVDPWDGVADPSIDHLFKKEPCRVRVLIRADPVLLSSDLPKADANTVVLFDLDYHELAQNEALLKEFFQSRRLSMPEQAQKFNGQPGVVLPTKEEVRVQIGRATRVWAVLILVGGGVACVGGLATLLYIRRKAGPAKARPATASEPVKDTDKKT